MQLCTLRKIQNRLLPQNKTGHKARKPASTQCAKLNSNRTDLFSPPFNYRPTMQRCPSEGAVVVANILSFVNPHGRAFDETARLIGEAYDAACQSLILKTPAAREGGISNYRRGPHRRRRSRAADRGRSKAVAIIDAAVFKH